MTHEISNIAADVARLYRLDPSNVHAAIALLESGETVPFIVRYQKARTGGMKHASLRQLAERLEALNALRARREVMLAALTARGVLTDALRQVLMAAETRAVLEDIYQPYATKHKSPAGHAKHAGLLPLADALSNDPTRHPEYEAAAFVNEEAGVLNVDAALEGAREILIERWASDYLLWSHFRTYFTEHAVLTVVASPDKKHEQVASKAAKKTKKNKAKPAQNQAEWADDIGFSAPIYALPLPRVHRLFRGRREGMLQLVLSLPDTAYVEQYLAEHVKVTDASRPADGWLIDTVRILWEKKLAPKLEAETLVRLRDRADQHALQAFIKQTRNVLLTPPGPDGVVMGLFFERRKGIYVAVLDKNGVVLDETMVSPFSPDHQWEDALKGLAKCLAKHDVRWIVRGNSLRFREADRLLSELAKRYPDMPHTALRLNEVGASAYTAPEMAISMARRFQHPLEALVAIPPKAFVFATPQQDMNQHLVARALTGVMMDCVSEVGVNINTASALLLSHVSGLNVDTADAIIAYREINGAFKTREQLRAVPGIDAHIFRQAAGFLYILDGEQALDATRIHPEYYDVVSDILKNNKIVLTDILNNAKEPDANLLERLEHVDLEQYMDACEGGLPVLRDSLHELRAPGRDPRAAFKLPEPKRNLKKLRDLRVGMALKGVVRRIESFGVFVDVGAEQQGLVHISALANTFVRDPNELLQVGDVVDAHVLACDLTRRRLSLTMRGEDQVRAQTQVKSERTATPEVAKKRSNSQAKKQVDKRMNTPPVRPINPAMANAFAKLKRSSS